MRPLLLTSVCLLFAAAFGGSSCVVQDRWAIAVEMLLRQRLAVVAELVILPHALEPTVVAAYGKRRPRLVDETGALGRHGRSTADRRWRGGVRIGAP